LDRENPAAQHGLQQAHSQSPGYCCSAVVQAVFLSWFLQPTHLHYFIFLQMKSVVVRNVFAKK